MMASWVTGLVAEAHLLRGLGPVAVGGGTAQGAGEAAERLVAEGARGLISFGLAGGLDPALPAGAIVIPRAVIEDGAVHPTDKALTVALGGATHGKIAMGEAIVADPAGKARLFATTGAVAVDLESGAVARVAVAHGLPFAVLRAVCDPAGMALPHAALVALDAGGGIGLLRVVGSLARNPGQLPTLIALARHAGAARAALKSRLRGIAAAR